MGKYSVREIKFQEGPQVTMGDRLKTAQSVTTFQSRFTYSKAAELWGTKVNTNGTITHLSNKDGVELQVGGNANDELVRQSLKYHAYEPGKQSAARLGIVFGSAKSGLRRRAGIYDDNDGLFIEQDGTTLNLVRRTSASGSPVDNTIAQSNWNLDTFDGSGDENNPSGINLDMSKIQLLVFDFKWYGAGPAKIGFEIGGNIYYAHEFEAANELSEPIFGNPNLPIRYGIKNTGGTGSNETMQKFGGSHFTDTGATKGSTYGFTASNGESTVSSISTRRPILSIRPKTTLNSGDFDGSTNRGAIIPRNFGVFNNGSEPIYYEIVYDGDITGGTSPNWDSVDDDSITEVDTSADSISGGRVLYSDYAESGGKKSSASISNFLNSRLDLVVDPDGANPINMSVVVTSVTGSNTEAGASINFDEQY